MSNSIEQLKKLRDATGASMMACKKALEENANNFDEALDALRKRGIAKAQERTDRSTGEGLVVSYIHNNRVGALVQLACETDFVAKNEQFQNLAKDIAMQITATNPLVLTPEEVSDSLLEKEKEIWYEQLKNEGKDEKIIVNILVNKEKKFREENSLLKQPYVKDPDLTIEQVLLESITKLGENIRIVKFARFEV